MQNHTYTHVMICYFNMNVYVALLRMYVCFRLAKCIDTIVHISLYSIQYMKSVTLAELDEDIVDKMKKEKVKQRKKSLLLVIRYNLFLQIFMNY